MRASGVIAVLVACAVAGTSAGQQPARARPAATTASPVETFETPAAAAAALIGAAQAFDVAALEKIFGPEFRETVLTGEYAQDRDRASEFAAKAAGKHTLSIDPKTGARAVLLVGDESWPFPIPIVKHGMRWSFDTKAGRQELLYRRIGANELDAIAICDNYVAAQHAYALKKRDGFDVHQYAQRIISTPGTEDGLAWQREDGSWDGPIGEQVAHAIAQGYSSRTDPYHGYFFKILKGQGSAAPLGEMDFVVNGAMIGGFALAAAPAEYGVTGVKTFIVSHDGVVYEKDFGAATLQEFLRMERFNPDRTWTPVSKPTP